MTIFNSRRADNKATYESCLKPLKNQNNENGRDSKESNGVDSDEIETESWGSTQSHEEDKLSESSDASEKKSKVRRRKRQKYAAMMYDSLEGEILVNWHEYESCKSGRDLNLKLWQHCIKEKFRQFNPSCKFVIRQSHILQRRKDSNAILRVYGKCGPGNCKHYSLTAKFEEGQSIKFRVHSAGKLNHEESLTTTTQKRGEERKKFLEKLKHIKPSVLQSENIRKMDNLDGNMGEVTSKAVLYTMRKEIAAAGDLHQDDMIDLMMRRRQEITSNSERYIQRCGEPLFAELFVTG